MGTGQVLRPDARGQAVVAIVGVLNHFFFTVERRDGDKRAEDFVAIENGRSTGRENRPRRDRKQDTA